MPRVVFAVVECDRPEEMSFELVAFAPDSRVVVAAARYKDKGYIVRLASESGEVLSKTEVPPPYSRQQRFFLSPAPDGKRFALGLETGILLLDTDSFGAIRFLAFPKKTFLTTHHWSRDGRKLVTGGWDMVVRCWDTYSGSLIAAREETETVELVAFADDESEILIGRKLGVMAWQLETGKATRRVRLNPKDGYCWDHALSPDRKTLLSLSERGCLLRTNTATWNSERFAAVHSSCGFKFSFSPDSKRVAVVSSNSKLLIWDVERGTSFARWGMPYCIAVGCAAFSPDGHRVGCSMDSVLFVLDFRPHAKGRAIGKASAPAGLLQCVEMSGSENQMDQRGNLCTPVNPLPIKCPKCRMPDLDAVPEPYYLAKAINSPVDIAPAEAGNFFVRESGKRVIEMAVPGQCVFYPTFELKTKAVTPWYLVVPQNLEVTGAVKPKVKRCPICDQPWTAHPGSEYEEWPISPHSKWDTFKSTNWWSFADSSWTRLKDWELGRSFGVDRFLYFSVRLETLFKKLKYRGLTRDDCCKEGPTQTDLAWVEEKLQLLKEPLKANRKARASSDSKDWFNNYLMEQARDKVAVHDFAAIEKEHRLKLPDSYKDFISKVGAKKFRNVDGEEGLAVRILLPRKLDFDEFPQLPTEKGDEARIEGVVFATTDHGDVFCFDVGKKNRDYPVFKYDHEIDDFEPYAANFTDCIRRFAGG